MTLMEVFVVIVILGVLTAILCQPSRHIIAPV